MGRYDLPLIVTRKNSLHKNKKMSQNNNAAKKNNNSYPLLRINNYLIMYPVLIPTFLTLSMNNFYYDFHFFLCLSMYLQNRVGYSSVNLHLNLPRCKIRGEG